MAKGAAPIVLYTVVGRWCMVSYVVLGFLGDLTMYNLPTVMHDTIGAAPFTTQIGMHGKDCSSSLFKIRCYLNLPKCYKAC